MKWGQVYRKTYYDHREYERLSVSLNASIWGDGGEHEIGTLRDLSINGCGFTHATAFGQGTILRLELHVPEDFFPIIVHAAVVRNVGISHSDLEFLQLNRAERERLRALVKSLLASRDAALIKGE
ncbi:MAG: PilZ domain-containing protein [Candidatus Binatia bacterium]